MAKSASADRYVVTVPVATTPADRHQMDRKFEAAAAAPLGPPSPRRPTRLLPQRRHPGP